jgi:hypothetical protein
VFVLITQDYTYLGVGAPQGFLSNPGFGYFQSGAVIEIPKEMYNEQCMTRLGLLPPANSPAGIVNPWSASLIRWSQIAPGGPPINGE